MLSLCLQGVFHGIFDTDKAADWKVGVILWDLVMYAGMNTRITTVVLFYVQWLMFL